MSLIDKSVIFIHPLAKNLEKLKEELGQKEDITLYDIEDLAEYSQLVQNLRYSVTFSSDLRRSVSYLDENKRFLKGQNTKNVIVSNQKIPPKAYNKLQRFGLNEHLNEDAHLRSLLYKVNMFYQTAERVLEDKLKELKRKEEEKQRQLEKELEREKMGLETHNLDDAGGLKELSLKSKDSSWDTSQLSKGELSLKSNEGADSSGLKDSEELKLKKLQDANLELKSLDGQNSSQVNYQADKEKAVSPFTITKDKQASSFDKKNDNKNFKTNEDFNSLENNSLLNSNGLAESELEKRSDLKPLDLIDKEKKESPFAQLNKHNNTQADTQNITESKASFELQDDLDEKRFQNKKNELHKDNIHSQNNEDEFSLSEGKSSDFDILKKEPAKPQASSQNPFGVEENQPPQASTTNPFGVDKSESNQASTTNPFGKNNKESNDTNELASYAIDDTSDTKQALTRDQLAQEKVKRESPFANIERMQEGDLGGRYANAKDSNQSQLIKDNQITEQELLLSKRKNFVDYLFGSAGELKRRNFFKGKVLSPFDQHQRIKGKNFSPIAKNFKPAGEMTEFSVEEFNKKFKINLKPIDKYMRGKDYHEEVDQVASKDKSDKASLEAQEKKKKNGFQEVSPEVERQRADWDDSATERSNKSDFNESDLGGHYQGRVGDIDDESEQDEPEQRSDFDIFGKKKKNSGFEEVMPDYGRERKERQQANERSMDWASFEEQEAEKKKRDRFEEVEIDYEREKAQTDEEEKERSKRKGFEEVVPEREGLKGIADEEKTKKDRDRFEEVDQDREGLKGKKGEDKDRDGRKGAKFDEVDPEREGREKAHKDELEAEKRSAFDILKPDREGLKGKKVDEDIYERQKGEFEELDIERNNKSHYQEGAIQTHWGRKTGEELEQLKRSVAFTKADPKEKIDLGEQTIDYAKLKKQYKEGKLDGDDAFDERKARKSLKQLLNEPEVIFYPAYNHAIDKITFFYEKLMNKDVEVIDLLIDFNQRLVEHFNGYFTLFVDNKSEFEQVYSGHVDIMYEDNPDDWAREVKVYFDVWKETKIPTWQDHTFTDPQNRFIYPIFEDNRHFGFIISDYNRSVKNDFDAGHAEFFIMMLKTVALSLYPYHKSKILRKSELNAV